MDTAPSNDDDSNESLSSKEVALYGALIIANARLYDVMLMILAEMNAPAAKKLKERHTEGLLWFPPPTFREEDDE